MKRPCGHLLRVSSVFVFSHPTLLRVAPLRTGPLPRLRTCFWTLRRDGPAFKFTGLQCLHNYVGSAQNVCASSCHFSVAGLDLGLSWFDDCDLLFSADLPHGAGGWESRGSVMHTTWAPFSSDLTSVGLCFFVGPLGLTRTMTSNPPLRLGSCVLSVLRGELPHAALGTPSWERSVFSMWSLLTLLPPFPRLYPPPPSPPHTPTHPQPHPYKCNITADPGSRHTPHAGTLWLTRAPERSVLQDSK